MYFFNPISNFEVNLEPLTFSHSIPPILKMIFFLNILLKGKANAPEKPKIIKSLALKKYLDSYYENYLD